MDSDLLVESQGHCFLCLDEASSWLSHDIKPDLGSDLVPSSIYSLQSFSRYLGIELQKLFHQEANYPIPPRIFEAVKHSKLKGELCKECIKLNGNFDLLYQKLEKIQMEVLDSLTQIFMKLLKSNETTKLERLRTLAGAGFKGKLDILENYRTDAMEKCAHILGSATPRVKVQNLTEREMKNVAESCIHNSSSDIRNPGYCSPHSEPELESIVIVKMEYSSIDALSSEQDNHNYPDGDLNRLSNTSPRGFDNTTIQNSIIDPNPNPGQQAARENTGFPTGELPQFTFNRLRGNYKCYHCDRKFKLLVSVKSHYNKSHFNAKFKCRICEKGFKDENSYRYHHSSAHMGVRVPCHVCGRDFPQKSSLQYSQRRSSNGRYVKAKRHCCPCRICGKSFNQTKSLQRHLEQAHSNPRKHVCDLCENTFA